MLLSTSSSSGRNARVQQQQRPRTTPRLSAAAAAAATPTPAVLLQQQPDQQQLRHGMHFKWGQPQQQQQQQPHQPQQQQQAPPPARITPQHHQKHSLGQTLQLLRASATGGNAAEAARSAPQLLTSAITQCESLSDALQVFCETSAAFNNVHVAAMVSRLPKILRSYQQPQHQQLPSVQLPLTHAEQQDLQQLLQDLAQLSEELLPCFSPREMANIAWGFAASGFYSRRLMQLLLGRCALASLRPQELSTLAWAVAKQGHDVPAGWVDELLQLSGRVLAGWLFKPQEAANMAWALAVLQRRCLSSGSATAAAAYGSSYSSCVRVDAAWKAGLRDAMAAQLGLWGAADVSQALWALAVLGCSAVEQPWLDRVLVRGLQLLGEGHMQSRHAATILWAVSRLQQQQQWAAGGVDDHSSSSSSSSLVVSPTVAVFAAAVAAKLPLLLRGEQQPLHFAAVYLSACQQLQLQPPAAAMDLLLAAAARQLEAVARTSSNHSNSSSSYRGGRAEASSSSAQAAGMAHKEQLCQDKLRQWQQSQQQQSQQQQPQQLLLDLAMLLCSLTKLSYRPAESFLDVVAAVVADRAWRVVDCHDALAALNAQWSALQAGQQQQQQLVAAAGAGLSSSSSSSAVTASKQQMVLQQRQQLLSELQGSMRGREVSLLLWAMGKLHYQPAASMLRPLKLASLRRRQHFNAADVGVLLWALARMRHAPGYQWVRFMLQHFLARIDDRVRGAADVANVVHALPLLPGGSIPIAALRQRLGRGVRQGLADAAQARFGEAGPRELVQIAQGFARLGLKPAPAWLQQHRERVRQLGRRSFSNRERRILCRAYNRCAACAAPLDKPRQLSPAFYYSLQQRRRQRRRRRLQQQQQE